MITELWRLARTPGDCLSPLLSLGGSAGQVNQGCVHLGFVYLQEWRVHNLSGQLVPEKKRSFFLCLGGIFGLCPLPFLLALCTTGKSLAPSFSLFPIKYLYTFVRFPWAFSGTISPRSQHLLIWQMLRYLRFLYVQLFLRPIFTENVPCHIQQRVCFFSPELPFAAHGPVEVFCTSFALTFLTFPNPAH